MLRDAKKGPLVYAVDDDEMVLELLGRWLGRAGYEVEAFSNGPAMLHALKVRAPDAILLDLNMEGMQGDDVLRRVRASAAAPPVVFVTGEDRADVAVQIMKMGAWDYHVKPLDRERLLLTLRNAIESYGLRCRVDDLEGRLEEGGGWHGMVGRDPRSQALFAEIRKVARTDVSVMLLGESGTGKELCARAIHDASGRRDRPFVALNCGAVPETLLESELFGHRKGAFTGAADHREGRFEAADGGTLFLDEIAEMSPQAQVRLLRVLQESTVTRVGDTREIPVDVRILAATHRDLEARIAAGLFREDLYYRLMVFPIHLPPLRDRPDDVPALAAHFLRKHAAAGDPPRRLTPEALDLLRRHRFPGNVRELENAIRFALVTADGDEIGPGDLPKALRDGAGTSTSPSGHPAAPPSPDLGAGAILSLEELERRAIESALVATEGNLSLAARRLGMGRTTLYRKIAAYGLRTS